VSIRRATPLLCAAVILCGALAAQAASFPGPIKHVLLISIDGMHALDFSNCSKGIKSIANGTPYCPQLAALAQHGTQYLHALASRPSDSFPGLTALVTGGTPRSTGAHYDVSYDRSLSPPAQTTPYGIVGGANLCPSVVGTQVRNDEEIDRDLTSVTAGGFAGRVLSEEFSWTGRIVPGGIRSCANATMETATKASGNDFIPARRENKMYELNSLIIPMRPAGDAICKFWKSGGAGRNRTGE
jgi:hypothetical protein